MDVSSWAWLAVVGIILVMLTVDLLAVVAGARAPSTQSLGSDHTAPYPTAQGRDADDRECEVRHQVDPFPSDAVAALRARLRGRLIRLSDPDYGELRGMPDGVGGETQPGLIVECAGVADVIAAVSFAREHDRPVAIRGGGRNISCHSGLAIDLSAMKSVRVDPIARSVRAEGGVTIEDLDHETKAFGLAVPTGMVTAASRVAGLTFGGRLGWLRRKYGVSCTNLLSADIVTADGRLVTAGPEADADLFWALQGRGCDFGIVTSFEFRTYPIGQEVPFAFVVHPGADARAALRFFREWDATAPDQVTAFAILWHAPEIEEIPAEHHGKPIAAVLAMYCGDATDGARVLQPLRGFGSPLADLSATMSYFDVRRFFDADHPPHAMRYYWKSCYVPGLTDEAIDILVDLNEASPSPHSTLDVWRLGRRSSSDERPETVLGDGLAPYLIGVESNWEYPDDDSRCLAWGRQAFRTLERFLPNSRYVSPPGLDQDSKQTVRDTFGGNMGRLQVLRERYDPTNLFQFNHITPTR